MELWIRSQDKMKLIRVIDIGIFEEQEGYTIYYDDSIDNMLGTYATKERALEVLDEIQRLMTPEINYNPVIKREMKPEDAYVRTTFERYETTIEILPYYIYIMPKE